jgi:hypothetical protein
MKTRRKSKRGSKSADQIASLLQQLDQIKADFRRSSSAAKMRLIRKLARVDILEADMLVHYHDILCFMVAYPDKREIYKTAEAQLHRFAERVAKYRELGGDPRARKLINSGLINTDVEFAFGYDVTSMLHKWHPRNIDIDWDDLSEDESGMIDDLLPLLVSWQENDTLDNDQYLTTGDWLKFARGKKTPSDLGTLLRLFSRSGMSIEVQRYLYEKLDLSTTWQLKNTTASRTMARVPRKRVFYQRGKRRGRSKDLRRELRKKATPLRRLSIGEGRKYVRIVNEELAVRYRELFPVTFANPAEVYVAEPGRGVQIFIFGSVPSVRLPLESNFGAMLTRNGMLIGYGVGATLFDRVEIAINVFPAFRSGESPFVIEQFFRIFYHHFGSRILLVRSRQMGDGDDEPLKSGAFWFYYKLGFRAINDHVRKLANQEYQVIKSRPGYRSPLKMLRRLSKSDVFMHADAKKMDDYTELSLSNLGKHVTKYFAERFDGDRTTGTRHAVTQIARVLGVGSMRNWTADEKQAFARLAPLVACIPDLARWPRKDKQLLGRLMRAKGSQQERKFVLLSNRHQRFRSALERLAEIDLAESDD